MWSRAEVRPEPLRLSSLELIQIETNKTVGCIQTTLANGWTMRQRAVSWTIGGIAVFALLLSVGLTMTDVFTRPVSKVLPSLQPRSSLTTLALKRPFTILSTSPLLYRFLTLFLFLQHIVATSILNLNYPVAYRSFAVNFAWSFGLFASSLDSRLQRSMDNLRARTGSKDAEDGPKSGTAYADRVMSPYNGNGPSSLTIVTDSTAVPIEILSKRFITPPTITSSTALPAGIPLLSNTIGIATGNAFLSLFYVALIILGSLAILTAVGFGVIWLIGRSRGESSGSSEDKWSPEQRYWAGVRAIGLRIVSI